MTQTSLTADLAERFAAIALGHVGREYPNKLDHVLTTDADARTPRQLHPIFHGSFDWHSCVHSYWMLARLRRMFPGMPSADRIRRLFDEAFTEENVRGELAYLARPSSAGFERPYGWAWLLMLAAELRRSDAPRWAEAMEPLESVFAARFRQFLPKATYPVRAGTHANTAFAMILASHYARAVGDQDLLRLLADRARRWFGADRAAQAWEPSGDDFLSPTLVEALCMNRLLAPDEFSVWFCGFLPELQQGAPKTLFDPAFVSDRSDGKIAHLDGLNLSRAWCMRSLLDALKDDPCRDVLADAAERHIRAAIDHVAGDYMGEHWLATYAVLALAPCS